MKAHTAPLLKVKGHQDYTGMRFLLSAGQHKPLLQLLTAPVFDLGLRIHLLHRNQQFLIYLF